MQRHVQSLLFRRLKNLNEILATFDEESQDLSESSEEEQPVTVLSSSELIRCLSIHLQFSP